MTQQYHVIYIPQNKTHYRFLSSKGQDAGEFARRDWHQRAIFEKDEAALIRDYYNRYNERECAILTLDKDPKRLTFKNTKSDIDDYSELPKEPVGDLVAFMDDEPVVWVGFNYQYSRFFIVRKGDDWDLQSKNLVDSIYDIEVSLITELLQEKNDG